MLAALLLCAFVSGAGVSGKPSGKFPRVVHRPAVPPLHKNVFSPSAVPHKPVFSPPAVPHKPFFAPHKFFPHKPHALGKKVPFFSCAICEGDEECLKHCGNNHIFHSHGFHDFRSPGLRLLHNGINFLHRRGFSKDFKDSKDKDSKDFHHFPFFGLKGFHPFAHGFHKDFSFHDFHHKGFPLGFHKGFGPFSHGFHKGFPFRDLHKGVHPFSRFHGLHDDFFHGAGHFKGFPFGGLSHLSHPFGHFPFSGLHKIHKEKKDEDDEEDEDEEAEDECECDEVLFGALCWAGGFACLSEGDQKKLVREGLFNVECVLAKCGRTFGYGVGGFLWCIDYYCQDDPGKLDFHIDILEDLLDH